MADGEAFVSAYQDKGNRAADRADQTSRRIDGDEATENILCQLWPVLFVYNSFVFIILFCKKGRVARAVTYSYDAKLATVNLLCDIGNLHKTAICVLLARWLPGAFSI